MTYNPRISENNTTTRQTVLTGPIDVDGRADFVQIDSGLNCGILATTPINVTFADDQDNYTEIITDSTAAWTGLTANTTNFLYVDRNVNTGELTYGSIAAHAPVYGKTFSATGKSLLHFNGDDASTNFVDVNSDVTWAFAGSAQLDTAQSKFGTSSMLLDTAGDYITANGIELSAGRSGFKLECFIKLANTGITRYFFDNSTPNHLALGINTSNRLILSLGNGSSWTIANGTAGSTDLTTTPWYHIRLQWDGATYKVYLDGSEEISVSSAVPFLHTDSELRLGAAASRNFSLNGWLDEFRYEEGPQTLGTFTAPTSAFSNTELIQNNAHWFDTSEFRMKYWNASDGSWNPVQRVFLGECETDGTGVTSVVTYALRGKSSHYHDTLALSTQYIKNHNIGTNQLEYKGWWECKVDTDGYFRGERIEMAGDHYTNGRDTMTTWDRNVVSIGVANSVPGILANKTTGTGVVVTVAEWSWAIEINRMGF